MHEYYNMRPLSRLEYEQKFCVIRVYYFLRIPLKVPSTVMENDAGDTLAAIETDASKAVSTRRILPKVVGMAMFNKMRKMIVE